MQIKPLNARVKRRLAKYKLSEKFRKQQILFESNFFHPSLHTEKLEPKSIGLYSFRLDRTYRAIFRINGDMAEIVHITKHYES